jgi:hypothetical protein
MVPTDDARMTVQIFEVVIWSDDVIGMEVLDIVALLKGSQAGPTWSLIC